MDVNNRNNVKLDNTIFCNDCVSSLKIGAGVRALLCNDYDCHEYKTYGFSVELIGPINTGEMTPQQNDWVSHIRLYPYDAKAHPMVSLFEEPNFDIGKSGLFEPGSFSHDQLYSRQIEYV